MVLSVARNLAKFRLTPGDITGLMPFWISGGVGISVGSCFIPGTGRMLVVPAGTPLTVTYAAGSLPANTFQYLYVYEDAAGAPKLEMSAVVPQSYWNTSYQKGTDATRRFVGAVLVGPGGNLFNFQVCDDGFLHFIDAIGAVPFRRLNSGTATSQTSVDLSPVVPPTTQTALVNLINAAAPTSIFTFTHPNNVGAIMLALGNSNRTQVVMPLYNRTMGYYNSASAGSSYIDVVGYGMTR